MKGVTVVCACFLTACSTQTVRCERHLTPINVPKRPSAEIVAPPQTKLADASAESGTTDAHRAKRPEKSGESVHPKPSAPAVGEKGTP